MGRLNPNHSALSICVAAVLLSGCGGPLGARSAADALIPGAVGAVAAHGGVFSANYSGTVKIAVVNNDHHYKFTFDGTGVASFLGPSRETGTLYENCTLGCDGKGVLTLRSSKHQKAAIFMNVEWSGPVTYAGMCLPNAQYTVNRGKRRFYGATGDGVVTFTCSGGSFGGSGSYTYSDQWSGTLDF